METVSRLAPNSASLAVHTEDELQEWIASYIARVKKIPREEIALNVPFSDYDIDSAEMQEMAGELEDFVKHALSPNLPYDYPTIERLAAHLAGGQ
jgi:acyl carrier protein